MSATGIIDRANLDMLYQGVNARFQMEIDKPSFVKDVSMTLESGAAVEDHVFLGMPPAMREWIGDRIMSELRGQRVRVANAEYANGIRVTRNDREDQKLDVIGQRIAELATSFSLFCEEKLMGVLESGFTDLGFDGKAIFATDHVTGDSGTQVNVATGGGSVLSDTSFATGKVAMARFKDDRGRPLGTKATHLIVPPELEKTAKGIVEVENLASGASNPDFNAVRLIVTPFISSATRWFLLDASRPVKPLVIQERRPVALNADESGLFDRGELRYGADWRGAFFASLWFLMYGSAGA